MTPFQISLIVDAALAITDGALQLAASVSKMAGQGGELTLLERAEQSERISSARKRIDEAGAALDAFAAGQIAGSSAAEPDPSVEAPGLESIERGT